MSARGLFDPNRTIHYRQEGKGRPLCKCKLPPGIRPRMLPRDGGASLPPPTKPDGEGLWTGTCSRCYELAQAILSPRKPPSVDPPSKWLSQYERDLQDADFYARQEEAQGTSGSDQDGNPGSGRW